MSTPERENLYRASYPSGTTLRANEEGGMPTMIGHFTRFNQWTEIRSRYEGHFLERWAPGSVQKTLSEGAERIKVMFQHGKDPQIGEKLLGVPTILREDGDIGPYYEVPLFDTSYNRDLMPGLEAGAYGASMRFSSTREDYVQKPKPGPHNPDGLPERTIREARIAEFGPVVFPAYQNATAGLRSITDLIHDVDALGAAGVILLDEERLNQARIFITRDIPAEPEPETSDTRDEDVSDTSDTLGEDAPPVADADPPPVTSHLGRGRRETATTHKWWIKGDQKEVPSSWQ